MKNLLLTALFMMMSISAHAAPMPDTSCEGHFSKHVRIVLEKSDNKINIKMIRTTIFGDEEIIADIAEPVQFTQDLESSGPYVGYQNQAYGNSFIAPELRERATLYYSEKAQLKIPYTQPGAKMEDARESTIIAPGLLPNVVKLQCKVIIFG